MKFDFMHHSIVFQAKLFQDCVLAIEGDEITAIETVCHVKNLENSLRRRRDDVFLTERTETEKSKLIGTGIGRATLEGQCTQFFGMQYYFSNEFNKLSITLSRFTCIPIQTMPWTIFNVGRSR